QLSRRQEPSRTFAVSNAAVRQHLKRLSIRTLSSSFARTSLDLSERTFVPALLAEGEILMVRDGPKIAVRYCRHSPVDWAQPGPVSGCGLRSSVTSAGACVCGVTRRPGSPSKRGGLFG